MTDRREPKVSTALGDFTDSATGALVGMALGGPVGAIGGAAAGVLAKALLNIAQKGLESRRLRMMKVVDMATQMSDLQVEDLERILLADPEKLDLALSSLEAASKIGTTERLALFAATIAFSTEAQPDELARLSVLARALQDLDSIHLQVLQTIARQPNGADPTTLERLTRVPIYELRAVVRLLELHGLIADEGRFNEHRHVLWVLAESGNLCIKLLKGMKEPNRDTSK